MAKSIQVVAKTPSQQEHAAAAGADRETATDDAAQAWAELVPLRSDPKRMSKHRIVAFSQTDAATVTFDMLRTKIRHMLSQNNWTSVAVTSPTPNCGKSMICSNLAFSFARQADCRVVLADLDLRRPKLAEIFGLEGVDSMEQFLKKQSPLERVFSRCDGNPAQGRMAVAGAARMEPNPAELLQSDDTARTLFDLKQRLKPNVILYDLPPMLSNDDLLAFLPNVDCVLLVVAAESSSLSEVESCGHELAERTNVLGVVLNKCRYPPVPYGYY